MKHFTEFRLCPPAPVADVAPNTDLENTDPKTKTTASPPLPAAP